MFAGPNIGLSIARGWMPMFEVLCEDIDTLLGDDKHGFHWTQLKEKFGAARFYWSMQGMRSITRIDVISELGVVTPIVGRGQAARGAATLQEQITELVDIASDKTQHSCIVCGESGTVNRDGGWVLILCEEHARQLGSGHLPPIWFEEDGND
jgi:hypothetical protein